MSRHANPTPPATPTSAAASPAATPLAAPLRFILASASPRRRELLAGRGYFPEVIPAEVTEHEDPHSDPREMVLGNAALKARFLADKFPDALVLGADTTVALGNLVLNKPADLAGAREMLRRLAGREHTVFTGVAFVRRSAGLDETHCISCRVRFKPFDDDVISVYFKVVNPLDKAGAYGIQEGRDLIIASYDEPLSAIMGLPIEFVAPRLAQLGVATAA
ncbi:MAG: Maf family protein [Puniceicoccales bacterium]|jgi:septum formation protein|nr:Maf family protein [Puniceicoccales bacterium]